MIHIRRSALVRHSPAVMYGLVNDVEAYPRRFDWCTGARILAAESASMIAHLDLRVGGLATGFTTRNTLTPPESIGLELVEGPFRTLSGAWHFFALGESGCKVELALDFEYAGLLRAVLRGGFEKLADRMVDDFCREADRAHG